ncbi:hypothetical protein G7075_11480 [Phycicoccus sp. HDW14]|uniref:hypothetical protein n=1 Tax=Phycicoccus sp. HDW14 TaxID=2714941 RepID=UPI00140930EB|nr:hypothetical protein [Phycicoccus sp. HDW14]QIM21603.1 hypothetical protein G7075_11480 [Phycicoccus sp. HDW14]
MTTDDSTRPLSADLGLEDRDEDTAPDATDTTATTTAVPTATTPAAPTATTAPAAPTGPRYRSGPAPFALLLGILGLLTAGAVLVTELTDVSVPWSDLGPWTIVGGGALVLLVGLVGLRSSRSQD